MEGSKRFAVEAYRDELRLFCYRMGGSLQDAEGLAEAVLFQAGGLPLPVTDADSMRTELFKIAARLCVEVLFDQPPRVLPHLAGPPSDPYLPPIEPEEGDLWLEPFPDDLHPHTSDGGEMRYAGREGISLHFLAALQSLEARSRICLIMADAMGWRAERLAEIIGTGTLDAARMLEGARESMSHYYDESLGRREPPVENKATEVLMRYLYPWETGDVEGLLERLGEDVVLQLPPSPSWYEGREAVKRHLSSYPLSGDARGRWRLLPRRANGQLAFGVYRRSEERCANTAHSVHVLHVGSDERVSEIIAFKYPELFPSFKLLPEVAVQG